jgi:cystathionine beta-lyase family protein involved in aluminum resistance
MIQTYPLESITVEQAKQMQFRLVDCITGHFSGTEILATGDVGVVKGSGSPDYTRRAEKVLSDFFGTEATVFVRGAGTGAIRFALASVLDGGGELLVHTSAIYPTTAVTLKTMKIQPRTVDFNERDELLAELEHHPEVKAVLVQLTRQAISDSYDHATVISDIRKVRPDVEIVTDDNYAVFKVHDIGVQCGGSLSCFSGFKLLGPEGIGIVTGKAALVEKIREWNYSGGSQVQGPESMEVLRGMIYAPVSLAIQAEVIQEVSDRLKNGEIPSVKDVYVANAQSKVLLVEFRQDIANAVLEQAEKLGAAAFPVGSESKYEFVPMFYRISGTFRKMDPTMEERMIRINPMRSGSDTIIRILKQSIAALK